VASLPPFLKSGGLDGLMCNFSQKFREYIILLLIVAGRLKKKDSVLSNSAMELGV
jgi:hypothetical protein